MCRLCVMLHCDPIGSLVVSLSGSADTLVCCKRMFCGTELANVSAGLFMTRNYVINPMD